MKTLFIVSSMHPKNGGVCQGIRNTIPQLIKSGIECEVVCLDEPTENFIANDAFSIHALGKGVKPWGYNKNLKPWLKANFHRFDSVTIHGLWLFHSHEAIKAMLAFRRKNTEYPSIYVMTHGMLDPYFQKAPERRLKAIRNEFYWKIFENKVINQADGVLFTCEEELLLARNTFPNYKPKREINVGYGIQPPPEYDVKMKEAFTAKVANWNGKPFLLFLSRINPKKGVDLMIDAYLKLENELGNIPQLIIAGPGLDDSYGQEMQVLASSSTNILFSGMLSGDAKWGAFYESEAFVLPSHQENFGIAVVEALACSKPVLISDKVNIWREIAAANGGIVKSDSENETYHLIKQWLTLSKTNQIKMNTDARKVYQQNFTIEHASKTFINVISDL